MRWIRLLFRIFGWLLTPLLAWAASFFGAVGGALIAMRMDDPIRGLIVTAACGGLAGFLAIFGWLRYLRRSPEVREVLAVTEDGTPDTTDLRVIGVVALGAVALAPDVQAQTIAGGVGRFYDDGGWVGYRLGFSTFRAGVVGVEIRGDAFQRAGSAGGSFAGLGVDGTLFKTRRRGPYLVAGAGTGFGSETEHRYNDLWTSWSAGAGYRILPVSFVSVDLEGRWRELSLGKRDGFELAAGIGLHFGRRRAPARPSAPATPAPISVSPADGRPLATLTDSIVATATAAMGRPYQWGGTGDADQGFDCSGLIQYAFGQHGVTLPRRSSDQARAGREVSKRLDQLVAGDLLTFSNSGGSVTHVGLYLGGGRFIHSATGGVQVSVLSDDDPHGRWWFRRWVGARRIVG